MSAPFSLDRVAPYLLLCLLAMLALYVFFLLVRDARGHPSIAPHTSRLQHYATGEPSDVSAPSVWKV